MKLKLILMTLCLAGAAEANPAQTRQQFIYDGPILNLLGSLEGPDGYDDITGHTRIEPPRPITRMSIADVLSYQDMIVKNGAASSAVGRYQFIRSTLRELTAAYHIDHQQLFDKRTQDYLARLLLKHCGFYNPDAARAAIGDCLAAKWAAVPVWTGKNKGKSRYHGKAGNRALTTIDAVRHAIDQRFTNPDLHTIIRTSNASPHTYLVAERFTYPDDGRLADKIPLR